MKSDAGGCGGGAFGDNVTIFLQMFYSESLHTDHILSRKKLADRDFHGCAEVIRESLSLRNFSKMVINKS